MASACAGPPASASRQPAALERNPVPAQDAPANDLLNAVLWMQRSVEYKATTLGAFALARMRLDQALTDPNWTAAPKEQTGAYQSLPPAVVLDVDESILDNSLYQAWMTLKDTSFDPKTWNAFVNTVTSVPIPGAVEFAKYADAKGVKVFYVSNRTAQEEEPTRKNLEKFGFPMGGGVDTMLMTGKQPDWGSAKGTRRAFIAKTYRIVLNIGDNFGDFVDEYRTSEAERLKVMDQNRDRWGREWIMIANPSYGSFESAPFGHDFKLSADAKRRAKRNVLDAWSGP
ncbi:MAG: 5-nucleotide phosphatase [Candidatus Rokuibacteriota bacterium]|nr:MAG: 5-nucleotide phosphatase [Candidatus Rokubacteria bacterium]